MSRLQCPHPGCSGRLSLDPGRSLVACSECGRASGPCPREGCDGLNRPLSRYCRRCGVDLGRGWPGTAWGRDALGGSGRFQAQESPRLGAAEPVLDLQSLPDLTPDFLGALELFELGGRIWIGGGDGRVARLDRFLGTFEATAAIDRHWDDGPIGLAGDGSWLLLTSPRGLKALDLLGLDDPSSGVVHALTLWDAGPRSSLVAGPILSEVEGEPHARTAVWLVDRRDGLALGSARLPSPGGPAPVPRLDPLPSTVGAAGSRVGTIAIVPTPGRPGMIAVASVGGLFRVELSGSAEPLPPKVVAVSAWPRVTPGPRGAVFLPGSAGIGRSAPPLVVALRDDRGPAIHLFDLEGGTSLVRCRASGVPVSGVDIEGCRGVLCRVDDELRVCNRLGDLDLIAGAASLPSANDWQVGGRLATASGVEVLGGRLRHFSLVFDLPARRLLRSLDSIESGSAPILLGRHLFRVESGSGSGSGGSLSLVRYPIDFTSGARPPV